MRWWWVSLLVPWLVACSNGPSQRVHRPAPPSPASAIAEVDGVTIDAQWIRSIMNEFRVSRKEALHMAIQEAMVLADAKGSPLVEDATTAALVRAYVDDFDEAFQKGDVPEDVLQRLYHKLESRGLLSHPELRASTHVVLVAPPDKKSPQDPAMALAFLRVLAPWLRSRTADPIDYLHQLAHRATDAYFKAKVEDLPPMARNDAYNVRRYGSSVVRSFLDELFTLDSTGVPSAPFPSPFGAHVLVVTKVEPPAAPSREELMRTLRSIHRNQAEREAFGHLLERLRRKYGAKILTGGGGG